MKTTCRVFVGLFALEQANTVSKKILFRNVISLGVCSPGASLIYIYLNEGILTNHLTC